MLSLRHFHKSFLILWHLSKLSLGGLMSKSRIENEMKKKRVAAPPVMRVETPS